MAMTDIARKLGGRSTGGTVTARCEGVRVTFRYYRRGKWWWTWVDAEIPAIPLVLHVRREGHGDAAQIERGEMVDVDVGDPVFDCEFVVEGAPARVVARLLDEDTREFLLAQDPSISLSTHGAILRLSVLGRVAIRGSGEDEHALELIRAAARIAARVAGVTSAVERETAASADPYRGTPVGRDPAQLHAAEVERVESLITERRVAANTVKVLLGLAGLVALLYLIGL